MEDLSNIGDKLYQRLTGSEKDRSNAKKEKKKSLSKDLQPPADKASDISENLKRKESLERSPSKRNLSKLERKESGSVSADIAVKSLSKGEKEAVKKFKESLKSMEANDLKYMKNLVAKSQDPKTYENILKLGNEELFKIGIKKDVLYQDFRAYSIGYKMLEHQFNQLSLEAKTDPEIDEKMASLYEPVRAFLRHKTELELRTAALLMECQKLAKEVERISKDNPNPIEDPNYQRAYTLFQESADKLKMIKQDFDIADPFSNRSIDTVENFKTLKLIDQIRANDKIFQEQLKANAEQKRETAKFENLKKRPLPTAPKADLTPDELQKSFTEKLTHCWKLHTETVVKDVKVKKTPEDERILKTNSPLIVNLLEELNRLEKLGAIELEPSQLEKFNRLKGHLKTYQKHLPPT